MKHNWNFGQPYFKSVLFTLTELVEKEIGHIMAGSKGAVIHDGWTKFGSHCFGECASLMKKVPVLRDGFVHEFEDHALLLLLVSPMSNPSEGGGRDDETTKFSAATHVRHLESVLEYYGVDGHD